jgi:hypothetical protein
MINFLMAAAALIRDADDAIRRNKRHSLHDDEPLQKKPKPWIAMELMDKEAETAAEPEECWEKGREEGCEEVWKEDWEEHQELLEEVPVNDDGCSAPSAPSSSRFDLGAEGASEAPSTGGLNISVWGKLDDIIHTIDGLQLQQLYCS